MMVSLLLVAAGCAHRTTYTGGSYSSGATYYSGDTQTYGDTGTYYEPATSKGAGARAMKNDTEVVGDTTIYTVSTPDAAALTQQGAGARALIGETEYVEVVRPDVEVTTVPSNNERFVSGSTDLSPTGGKSGYVTGNLSKDDANFAREAMQAGAAEVRMGELVQQKAQNSSLKSFGDMIVTDHTRANEELQRLATQKQMTETMSINPREQAKLDRLSNLSGPEFDRVAQREAVDAHAKAIKLFKHEAEHGQDQDLKAFAQKTLPILEQHLQDAKSLKLRESNT
jgi:putative membrane protein